MSNDTAASRMRQNLLREYGIKVFNIGRPILCIRIPRSGIEELGPAESDAILKHMEPISKQLRPDEIRDVFIIADTNYVVIEPNTFFVQLETKGQSLVNEPVSTTATSIHVNREKQTLGPIDRTPKNVISVQDEKHEPDRDEKAVSLNTTPITSSTTEEGVITTDEMTITEETTSQLESQGSTGSRDSTSSTGSVKDEKTVSKILTDFARNGQKKKIVTGRLRSGRRAEVLTLSKRGRYVRFRMPGEKISDIAIAPTVRAAAHHAENGKIVIKKGDLREKIRRRRVSTLINIVFDTSGSMDEKKKIQITTTVVLALLKDAYQRRDRVSLVTYSGRSADLVLPFTSSVEAAKRYLEKV
ncbi:MAG: VWA domain-containing protein, partial [Methanosarcinaceae archaeon]|nr:VWA domain-containing protein [Methanosarcinaceae archaeon]